MTAGGDQGDNRRIGPGIPGSLLASAGMPWTPGARPRPVLASVVPGGFGTILSGRAKYARSLRPRHRSGASG
jgi:hypothetical protein